MNYTSRKTWRNYLPHRHEWLIAGICLLLLSAVSLVRWRSDRDAILDNLKLETESTADQGFSFMTLMLSKRLIVTYSVVSGATKEEVQPRLNLLAQNLGTFKDFFVIDLEGNLLGALISDGVPPELWRSAIKWAIAHRGQGEDILGQVAATPGLLLPTGKEGFFALTRAMLEDGRKVYVIQAIPMMDIISRSLDGVDRKKVAVKILVDGDVAFSTGRFDPNGPISAVRSTRIGGRSFVLQVSPGAEYGKLIQGTGGTFTGLWLPLLLSLGVSGALLAALQFARRAMVSDQRFRDFAAVGSDILSETDAEGRIIYMQSTDGWGDASLFDLVATTEPTIADVTEMTGMSASDRARLLDQIATQKPFRNMGVHACSRSGVDSVMSISGSPYFDSKGHFSGYRLVTSDLEGKTQARSMMERAEALLSSAVEAISEAFALFDSEDRLVLCNQRYRDRLPAELWPKLAAGPISFSEITLVAAGSGRIVLKPGQTAQDFLAERLEQRRRAPSLTTRRMGDGSWIQVWEWPVKGGGIVSVQTDVTAAKLHEAALSESETRFRTLVQELPLGLVVAGDDRALFLNTAFARMFGYAQNSDILALDSLLDLLAPAGDVALDAYLTPGSRHVGLIRVHGRNTAPRWAEMRAMPVVWQGQNRQMLLLTDVTDQQEMMRALQSSKDAAEAANRSKSDFLANVSHELRTPLNAIIGFSEILVSELFGPVGHPRYHEYAEDIHKSGNHLLQIINDILDVAKAEAGRLELQEEDTSIPALVEAALRMVRDRATAGGVTVVTDLPDDLPRVFVDQLKMKQVLLNLLSNAVKFTPSGGGISVSTHLTPTGEMRITVQDNGIGMPKDKIAMALEPFTQVDSSLARQFEGTGLGLPLVNAFCRLHGASFSLDSDVGKGTTAIVTLPAGRIVNETLEPREQAV